MLVLNIDYVATDTCLDEHTYRTQYFLLPPRPLAPPDILYPRTQDPPPPRVAVEAFRLRVAMDAVQILPKDAEEAPVVVCTIEVSYDSTYICTTHGVSHHSVVEPYYLIAVHC